MTFDLTLPIYMDEAAARAHLEAVLWPNGPTCPHCGNANPERITRLEGEAHRAGLLTCRECRKQFSVTVGTVFERSHVPLHKWVLATHLLSASKKGISSHQLHRMLGVTYKTAWFMSHRIREAMVDSDPTPMGGKGKTVEADETFQGPTDYEFKNNEGWKPMMRTKRKVVTLVERNGRARSIKADDLTSKTIREILVQNVSRHSTLMTDEAQHYTSVGKEYRQHFTVNHSAGIYGMGFISTNTVEGYFSIFKRGMRGVYQHCGEQHLQRYLTEFDFRYSNRSKLGIEDAERALIALKGATGKRLTYRRISESAEA